MNTIRLHDKNLYYIGGIVRDEILGYKNFDVDLTYVGNAIDYAKNLEDVEIIKVNEPFGTVHVKLDGVEVDIASTRSEIYPKNGHLPKVSNLGCSLKEDVLRRDFTINSLAKNTLTGEIVDYTGGLDDLKNKIIRVLHDKSFIEDPTRILRALKFSARFGFDLDNHSKILQQEYLSNVNYDMSYKRLKKELIETFELNKQSIFEKFINDNIYKLLTEKTFNLPKINIEELINQYKPDNIWIIYVGLLPDIEKLPLTKQESKIINDFNYLKTCSFKDDYEIYKAFSKSELETCIMYSTIDVNITKKYLDKLQHIKLLITGKDLINLGIKPSDKFAQCFDYVLKEKIKCNVSLTKEDELNLAKEFFNYCM